jgi:hypothetical protein
MRIARTGPTPDRAKRAGKSRRFGVSIFLVALSLGCGTGTEPTSTPVTPAASGLQRVEVTTVTTGVRLDLDGYGVLNDEWGYDVGDGATVAVPANGAVTLYLRPGGHILSLVGVATNCSGENLDDRPVTVEPGAAVTLVVFQLVCNAA